MERIVGESKGICTTCNNARTCVHLKGNTGFAIWDCENFDDFVPPTANPRVLHEAGVRTEESYSAYLGLCMNCAVRETCVYSKPEGGVWHCEEYAV